MSYAASPGLGNGANSGPALRAAYGRIASVFVKAPLFQEYGAMKKQPKYSLEVIERDRHFKP